MTGICMHVQDWQDGLLGVEESEDLVVEVTVGGYCAVAVDCGIALEVCESAAGFLDD